MKNRIGFLFSLVMFLLLTVNILPQTQSELDDEVKHACALKKPFIGVNCTDASIRLDCVCKLGEMKSEKALFALMRILREDPCEAVRIAAAQSLVKLGDSRGVFLVARHAKYSDSAKLSALCEKFYKAYQYSEYLAKQATDTETSEDGGLAITALNE